MFHFKIVYPFLGGSNDWFQTSNPASSSSIEGYQPVHLDYKLRGRGKSWGGLGLCNKKEAFICDTPIADRWWMCIGCQSSYENPNTIPGPWKKATTKVELYIKPTGWNIINFIFFAFV